MVDPVNPSSQFHPYQPETSIPSAEQPPRSGMGSILNKVGLSSDRMGALGSKVRNIDVRGGLGSARNYARNNSGMVLGGLAALAIGAGLWRRRSVMNASR